jgi:hypothetical protein
LKGDWTALLLSIPHTVTSSLFLSADHDLFRWSGQNFLQLFQEREQLAALRELLLNTVRQHAFDGLTIEVWSQLGGKAK